MKKTLLLTGAPLYNFLEKNSSLKERTFFAKMRHQGPKQGDIEQKISEPPCKPTQDGEAMSCTIEGEDFSTLIPAFLITELKEAFALGFLIFLPFLVIDLIVAQILLSLGMMMVSPVTIAMPFKLLLFVACDGWFLFCKNLVLGYLY